MRIFLPLLFVSIIGTGLASLVWSTPDTHLDRSFDYMPLLDKVPADTPFLYAFNRPLPPALAQHLFELRRKKLTRRMEEYLAFHAQRQTRRGTLAESDADRLIVATIQRLLKNFSKDGIRNLGIDLSKEAVLYGHGLAPVFRMPLVDPERFAAAVDGILMDAKVAFAREPVDGGWHLFLPLGKGELHLFIAVEETDLILSILPSDSEPLFSRILRPTSDPSFQSLSRSRLDQIIKSQGYDGHAFGYVDLNRVLELMSAPVSTDEKILHEHLGGLLPTIPPGCMTLVRKTAQAIPILHAGTVEVSPESYVSRFGAMVSPSVSEILGQLTNQTLPEMNLRGLGGVGLALDMRSLGNAAAELIGYLDKHKNTCSWVDEQALKDYRALLLLSQSPLLQDILGGFVRLNEIRLSPDDHKLELLSLDAVLFLRSSKDIVRMLEAMYPKFAQLNLLSGAPPVQIDTPVGDYSITSSLGLSGDRMILAIGGEHSELRFEGLRNISISDQHIIATYYYRGNELADLLDFPNNPQNVKDFLELLGEQGAYRGSINIDHSGPSITHFFEYDHNLPTEPES